MELDTNQILGSEYKVNKKLVRSVVDSPIILMTNNLFGRTNTSCHINLTTYGSSKQLKDSVNCNETNVNKFENVTWEYNGTVNFSYDDSFLFSVIKEGSYFTNSIIFQNLGSDVVRYDSKYHGIPVAFNTGTGLYNISVNISGLGNNSHFDKIKESSDFSYGYDFTKYTCPIIISNILYENECRYKPCTDDSGKWCLDTSYKNPDKCPAEPNCESNACRVPDSVKSLDLVYRLIDMGAGNADDIFPGIEGKGRKTK